MTKETVIRKFFQEFEKGHYDEIVKLFAPNGKVHSPIYGSKDVADFYKNLSVDLQVTKIEIKNIFIDKDKPNLAVAHIVSSWKLKTGKTFSSEIIDIFEFNADDTQLQSIKIIYDTYTIRQEFKQHVPA